MMDSLRNAAKSWVAKVLIGLLAVSFGVWGIADVFRGYSRGALARVGGVDITGEEFSRAFSRYLQDLQRQTGQVFTPEDARKFGLDRQVLNNLIQTAAVDNQARGMGLAVSDAFIAKEPKSKQWFRRWLGLRRILGSDPSSSTQASSALIITRIPGARRFVEIR